MQREEKKKARKQSMYQSGTEYPFLPHSYFFLTSSQPLYASSLCPNQFFPLYFWIKEVLWSWESTGLLQEDAYLSWGFLTLFWGLLLWGPWDVISTIFPLPAIKKSGLDCPLGIIQTTHHVIVREYFSVLWKDLLVLSLVEWMSLPLQELEPRIQISLRSLSYTKFQ